MTYYDFISKMTTLVQNGEKLMAEIEKMKPYTYFEGEFRGLYDTAWTNWDLSNFNLNFAKNSKNKHDKYHEQEYQEIYDKYSKIHENLKIGLENLKVRVEEQKFIDKGSMTSQEFRKKLVEYRSEFEKLGDEVFKLMSYNDYYSKEDLKDFYKKTKKHINDIDMMLENKKLFQEEHSGYYKTKFIEYKRISKNYKSKWEELQLKYPKDKKNTYTF